MEKNFKNEQKIIFPPPAFHLQVHITDRCNLHCRHCYWDKKKRGSEINPEQFSKILNQYIEVLKKWKAKGKFVFHGGEPLLHKFFFQFLEKCYKHKGLFKYGVITNGTLITRETARRFKQLSVSSVQLSIEGKEKTNDLIRGRGTFKKIINAASFLVNEGIRTVFSFTSSKLNYKDFFEVVELGKKIGVDAVWTDRLVPIGRGKEMRKFLLEPLELKKFYQIIVKSSNNLRESKSKTQILISRPLFFLAQSDKKEIWDCCHEIGSRIIAIGPEGNVFPCRRLPIKIGNVFKKNLYQILSESKFLKILRENCYTNEICIRCPYFKICRGGAKCIANAYFGSPFAPDPQCWRVFGKLPSPSKKFTIRTSKRDNWNDNSHDNCHDNWNDNWNDN